MQIKKSVLIKALKIILALCIILLIVHSSLYFLREMRIFNQLSVLEKRSDGLKEALNQELFFDINGALSLLSSSGYVLEQLHNPADTQNHEKVQLQLSTVKSLTGADLVYILNAQGVVVASSKYYKNDTQVKIIGNNYSFRPYFKNAITGRMFMFPAVGVTTKERGLYLSIPVFETDSRIPVGVAVIKINISHLDSMLGKSGESTAVLLTANGIIFASSDPKLLYQSTRDLSPQEFDIIKEYQQFPLKDVKKTPFTISIDQKSISEPDHIVAIESLKIPSWNVAVIAKRNYSYPLAQVSYQTFIVSAIWTAPLLAVVIALLVTLSRIRRLKSRYIKIFNGSFHFMAILDVNGVLLEVNDPAKRIFKKAIPEQVGMYFWDTIWWSHSSKIQQRLRVAIEKAVRGEIDQFEAYHIIEDKTKLFADCSVSPIYEPNGQILNVIVEGRDTTVRKKLEQRLRHSNKIEAIGQLAGGIAHDFNNMLGGIIGYTEIIESQYGDDTRLLKWIGGIYNAATRAADLTEQLLLFSRKGHTKKRIFSVNDMVSDAVKIIERTVDKRINIELDLQAQKSSIYGDAAQLENIIINFGINSRDAMPHGGTFKIETENVTLAEEQAKLICTDMEGGEFVMVHISDTGIGIDEEIFDKIFDPFFTTKEVGKGTGLGLSAVYGIVSAHHGGIRAKSKVGVGTDFYVYLPVIESMHTPVEDEPEESETKRSETKVTLPIPKNLSVLVIDDEESIKVTLDQMLKSFGYTIVTTGSGKEALEVFSDEAHKFDLVILDVAMPDINGAECFAALKKMCPEMHIIMTSGFAENAELVELRKTASFCFLQKPFNRKTLSEAIIKCIRDY